MSPAWFSSWIERFEALRDEMVANDEPQSLMVAASMCSMLGSIAALAEGDERSLRSLYAFTTASSKAYVEEHARRAGAPPN